MILEVEIFMYRARQDSKDLFCELTGFVEVCLWKFASFWVKTLKAMDFSLLTALVWSLTMFFGQSTQAKCTV